MQFNAGSIYHIYNRGNNKQPIFFTDKNYWFFLEKVKKNLAPNGDILAWCLMPNHFHFLIHANEKGSTLLERPILISKLADGFRLALSAYGKAINVQEKRAGNLFQQKTKSKLVSDPHNQQNYALTAFHYIHQNPVKAGLAGRLEDWEFSSYRDYAGLTKESICNKEMALDKLGLSPKTFTSDSYAVLPDSLLDKIF